MIENRNNESGEAKKKKRNPLLKGEVPQEPAKQVANPLFKTGSKEQQKDKLQPIDHISIPPLELSGGSLKKTSELPKPENISHRKKGSVEEDLRALTQKGTRYRQSMQSAERTGVQPEAARSKELSNMVTIDRNLSWMESNPTATVTKKIKDYLGSDAPSNKTFNDAVDSATSQILRGANRKMLDPVDVIQGAYRFDQASKTISDQLTSGTDETGLREKARVTLVEQVMLRISDEVPVQNCKMLTDSNIEDMTKTMFGEKAAFSKEKIVKRISDATSEVGYLSYLVKPHIGMENREATDQMSAHLRHLTSDLAERLEEGGQMPTLVVQGADIGLPYDVIMGHPNTYSVSRSEHAHVVADFYLVEPKSVHRLPTVTKQYSDFSIDFEDQENVRVALRLFKDGSVDFGWPLLTWPHRPIDRIFTQLNAKDGLMYTKNLLAALATDASTPPEYIEREAPSGSAVKALKDGIAQGKSPMEIMSTVVIPERIEVINRWREETSKPSGTGTPKRWHIARAHTRQLQEGYTRSEDNLKLYLDDLRKGAIMPLSDADHTAILNGTKSYIHPTERGDPRLGRVTAKRAKIGEGETRKIIDGKIPESEEPQEE